MATTLQAPNTPADCEAEAASLELDRLTAPDAMGIGQAILALALQHFLAAP